MTNDSAPSYAQAVDAAKAEALEAGVANVLHLQVRATFPASAGAGVDELFVHIGRTVCGRTGRTV